VVGSAAVVALALGPVVLAPACGGAPKQPVSAAGTASSSVGSVPLFTQSSGASPIHIVWKAGACDVEMRDGLGATYRFEEANRDGVQGELKRAADGCLARSGGTQGTAYVEAKVAASGALSDVVVSPGGAVSTDVVGCLTKSFAGIRLAAPRDGDSVLLLFLVSACPPP
jgi:hypothetical protein